MIAETTLHLDVETIGALARVSVRELDGFGFVGPSGSADEVATLLLETQCLALRRLAWMIDVGEAPVCSRVAFEGVGSTRELRLEVDVIHEGGEWLASVDALALVVCGYTGGDARRGLQAKALSLLADGLTEGAIEPVGALVFLWPGPAIASRQTPPLVDPRIRRTLELIGANEE